jgi:hypothetical protein
MLHPDFFVAIPDIFINISNLDDVVLMTLILIAVPDAITGLTCMLLFDVVTSMF